MSDAFSIEIEGLDELAEAMGRLAGKTTRVLQEGMEQGVLYVHQSMPPYPPGRADSRYRRTGELGRKMGTEVKTMGRTVTGIVGGAAPYAPLVIGTEQAGMHRGRWWRLRDVVQKALPTVIRLIEQKVAAAIERS